MGGIGIPEVFVLFFIAAIWLVPIAAAVWLLVTIREIRASQRAMEQKLEALAQALRRS